MKSRVFLRLGLLCLLVFAMTGTAFAAATIMKIGSTDSEFHPNSVALSKAFKPYVEEKSGGKIKVELFFNSQLGGMRELVEGMQMGTIQGCISTSSAMAGFEKRLQVIDLPFLFTTKKAAFAALDGDLGKKLNEGLLAKKIVVLAYGDNGFREMTNNRKPIYTPEDMKGLKIRTMENPMQISTFKLLGANPTPISYSELYTALQQKTVDAQENSPVNIYDAKLQEVQKYLSLTSHQFSTDLFVTSKTFMDKLPKDLQTIIVAGGKEYAKMQRSIFQKEEDSLVDKLKKEGMQVNTLTPEQKEMFVKMTRPVYEQYKKDIGDDILNTALKYK